MNIIVLGAGAIGCYVSGRLVAAGERLPTDVWRLWAEHALWRPSL